MQKISKSIFIAPTRERARDFALSGNEKGFLETFALAGFVHHVYNSLPESIHYRQITNIEEQILFEKVIEKTPLKHFQFIKDDPLSYANTIKSIRDFFYLVKSNNAVIGDFRYDSDKQYDLESLYRGFEEIKKSQYVNDYPDRSVAVLETLRNRDWMNRYNTIYCDSFEENGVHLWGSGLDSEVYGEIAGSPRCTRVQDDKNSRLDTVYHNTVFNRINEIEEAARIVKTLVIEEKCQPEDIVIAAGNLGPYLTAFEDVFARYNMPVFITGGVPLAHFPVFNDTIRMLRSGKGLDAVEKMLFGRLGGIKKQLSDQTNPHLQSAMMKSAEAVDHLLHILRTIRRLGITHTDIGSLIFDTYRDEKVYVKRPGVMVQELNQTVHRKFERLILLGVDSENIPGTITGNFLYGAGDTERIFGQNNPWKLYTLYLDQVFRNSRFVHVISAKNENGKRLELSRILVNCCPDIEKRLPFSCSDKNRFRVLNREDILNLKEPCRVKLDPDGEDYIASITTNEYTSHDGVLKKFYRNFSYFSVSQFNQYARCPLSYYFSYILNLKPPESDEGLDAMTTGTFAHACFETMSREVIDKRYSMPGSLTEGLKKKMQAIAEKEYRKILKEKKISGMGNIYHRMQFHNLTRGLSDEDIREANKGILLKFLEYVYDPENRDRYRLNSIHSVEHVIEPGEFSIDGIPVKGLIDRVDMNDERIAVIDYKPTKIVDKSVREELIRKMLEYREFQLPVYALYSHEQLDTGKNKTIETFLLTFRDSKACEFSKVLYRNGVFTFMMETGGRNSTEEELVLDDFEVNMRKEIKKIVNNIKKGDFRLTPGEEACRWCNFITICHQDLVHKEMTV